jgi:ATP-dependent protease ClpP protease subunit
MVNEGATAITVLFSSWGGSTGDGMALYSYLRALPVELTMHAVGPVSSIAVPVFLAGAQRLAVDHASFFFHEYTWTDRDASRLTQATITERHMLLSQALAWSRSTLKSATNTTDAEIDRRKLFSGEPILLSATEAQQIGIISAVAAPSISAAAAPRIVVW